MAASEGKTAGVYAMAMAMVIGRGEQEIMFGMVDKVAGFAPLTLYIRIINLL